MKLELELTDYEYGTLLRALDFYSRIGCGQIEELYWNIAIEHLIDGSQDRKDAAVFEVNAFKKVVLGLPSITIKQAIGLSFTIGLFKNNPPSSEKKPFGEAVATALLTGAFVLFMGWIIHII